MSLLADSESPDQTARVRRLSGPSLSAYAGRHVSHGAAHMSQWSFHDGFLLLKGPRYI